MNNSKTFIPQPKPLRLLFIIPFGFYFFWQPSLAEHPPLRRTLWLRLLRRERLITSNGMAPLIASVLDGIILTDRSPRLDTEVREKHRGEKHRFKKHRGRLKSIGVV
jgi:hypothetical protein